MATKQTDPGFVARLLQIGGSYVDASGVARDITLNLTYEENDDSSLKAPLTKREIMALELFSAMLSSPVYADSQDTIVAYKAVTAADLLITTLNNTPVA